MTMTMKVITIEVLSPSPPVPAWDGNSSSSNINNIHTSYKFRLAIFDGIEPSELVRTVALKAGRTKNTDRFYFTTTRPSRKEQCLITTTTNNNNNNNTGAIVALTSAVPDGTTLYLQPYQSSCSDDEDTLKGPPWKDVVFVDRPPHPMMPKHTTTTTTTTTITTTNTGCGGGGARPSRNKTTHGTTTATTTILPHKTQNTEGLQPVGLINPTSNTDEDDNNDDNEDAMDEERGGVVNTCLEEFLFTYLCCCCPTPATEDRTLQKTGTKNMALSMNTKKTYLANERTGMAWIRAILAMLRTLYTFQKTHLSWGLSVHEPGSLIATSILIWIMMLMAGYYSNQSYHTVRNMLFRNSSNTNTNKKDQTYEGLELWPFVGTMLTITSITGIATYTGVGLGEGRWWS